MVIGQISRRQHLPGSVQCTKACEWLKGALQRRSPSLGRLLASETIDGRDFRLYWQQQQEVVEYMTCI